MPFVGGRQVAELLDPDPSNKNDTHYKVIIARSSPSPTTAGADRLECRPVTRSSGNGSVMETDRFIIFFGAICRTNVKSTVAPEAAAEVRTGLWRRRAAERRRRRPTRATATATRGCRRWRRRQREQQQQSRQDEPNGGSKETKDAIPGKDGAKTEGDGEIRWISRSQDTDIGLSTLRLAHSRRSLFCYCNEPQSALQTEGSATKEGARPRMRIRGTAPMMTLQYLGTVTSGVRSLIR